jgi:hypothetical protein
MREHARFGRGRSAELLLRLLGDAPPPFFFRRAGTHSGMLSDADRAALADALRADGDAAAALEELCDALAGIEGPVIFVDDDPASF